MKQTQIKETRIISLEGVDWLPDVLDLHAQIHAELPAEKKHSFLVRGVDYFVPLLNQCYQQRALIGVLNEDGQLLGMCSVIVQENWQEAQKAQTVTCTQKVDHILGMQERISVLQSLCLTEAAKGMGLGTQLIQSILLWSQRQGIAHVFAQVAHDNPCSWVQLMRQGFDLVASWTHRHGRYLLHCGVAQEEKEIQQTCLAAKREFYIGANSREERLSLFEKHLAQTGRITYHPMERQTKLLRFDFVK